MFNQKFAFLGQDMQMFKNYLNCDVMMRSRTFYDRGVKSRGSQDDSTILNEFWQYCNDSSWKKRLNPLTQATLERYRLFFIWRSTPFCASELDF